MLAGFAHPLPCPSPAVPGPGHSSGAASDPPSARRPAGRRWGSTPLLSGSRAGRSGGQSAPHHQQHHPQLSWALPPLPPPCSKHFAEQVRPARLSLSADSSKETCPGWSSPWLAPVAISRVERARFKWGNNRIHLIEFLGLLWPPNAMMPVESILCIPTCKHDGFLCLCFVSPSSACLIP